MHSCTYQHIRRCTTCTHAHLHTRSYRSRDVFFVFLDSPAHPANCFRCLKFESMGRVRNTYFFNTSTFQSGCQPMVPLRRVSIHHFLGWKIGEFPDGTGSVRKVYPNLSMDPSNWPLERLFRATRRAWNIIWVAPMEAILLEAGFGMAFWFLIDAGWYGGWNPRKPNRLNQRFLESEGGCDSLILRKCAKKLALCLGNFWFLIFLTCSWSDPNIAYEKHLFLGDQQHGIKHKIH